LEDAVNFCSTIAECAACGGTGWLDCKDCENPKWIASLAKKAANIAGSTKARLAKYDQAMGKPLRKVETAHFSLVWELDSLKVDKRQVEHHELMHLYAARLETLFTDYCAAFQCNPRDFAEKQQVFVWWLPADQDKGSLLFAGQGGPRGIKLLGSRSVFSTCGNKQFFKDDAELHRSIVHNVAHLLLSHQAPSQWLGNIKGGWVDEGVAHWFEEKYFGVCTNYCYQEQNTAVDFKGGRWKPIVRKMVAGGELLPPVGEVLKQNTDTLTLPMHAVAFSYVDYLLALDGKKFNKLCYLLRGRAECRDALDKAFGMNPLQLEETWKAWVLETYPVR
jgi:hypothetical protein